VKTYLTDTINIPLARFDNIDTVAVVARFVGLKSSDISRCTLHKKSIDARRKTDIKFACSFTFSTEKHPKNAKEFTFPTDILLDVNPTASPRNIVIVGSGPAGLFAARYLTLCGHHVTIVERGGDIDARIAAVNTFFAGGTLDENCNIQFGLGGAGTFSDGKLTTGISSPYTYTVFREFVRAGAPAEIMHSATPHIGTDNLRTVVATLRDNIRASGGVFLFDSTVTSVKIDCNFVTNVHIKHNITSKISVLPCDDVIFAIGHSARDTFRMLFDAGVDIVSKPFAVGVRVEHTRQFISSRQYGALWATHRDLQSASYKLAANFGNGRSCYSFCMCPGGTVVAAASEQGGVVCNGMSNFDRLADNSNSALVVNVNANDFGSGIFDGVAFQRQLESAAFTAGGGNFAAPCQNVTDFLAHKKSATIDMAPSYPRGVVSVNLWDILPQFVCETLAKALREFGKRIDGFDCCGVLTAVETRTSSPVKIPRDADTFASNITNLYPAGEGAGHAGGIVSAAVDGLKVAVAIAKKATASVN
jgi:uncharacterized FAD-dependent dehydrogenase